MAREFPSKFTWPRRFASPAQLLKKDRVSKESLHFKCSGSEGLCLCPMLATSLQVVVLPVGGCVPQITSFMALCDVLDLLVHCQEGVVTAALLQGAIINHLRLYKLAYGTLGWVFKHMLRYTWRPSCRRRGC